MYCHTYVRHGFTDTEHLQAEALLVEVPQTLAPVPTARARVTEGQRERLARRRPRTTRFVPRCASASVLRSFVTSMCCGIAFSAK